MKIRDLLEVLNTDSVVLARENDILVDCETPYIDQALTEYIDEEIEKITPLNNEIVTHASKRLLNRRKYHVKYRRIIRI